MQDHLAPRDLCLKKPGSQEATTCSLCNIVFFMYYFGLNVEPPEGERGHLRPWDLHLNKLGKGTPGHATYLILSI